MLENYKKSFLFGLRFTALFFVLLLPPIIVFAIDYGVYKVLYSVPITHIDRLNITTLLTYEDDDIAKGSKATKKNTLIMEYKTGVTVYGKLNRLLSKNEVDEAYEKMDKSIDSDEELKEIITTANKAYKKDLESWEGTVVYPELTFFGNLIFTISIIASLILFFASYFPIFSAFRNLIKTKKIF